MPRAEVDIRRMVERLTDGEIVDMLGAVARTRRSALPDRDGADKEAAPPPKRGTWAYALACRDLAVDLGALRESGSQVSASLYPYQRDILRELLGAEFEATEAALVEQFDRMRPAPGP